MSDKPINSNEVYLILENIRSLYNVGAIFRTAEAAQAKIFLVGRTGILLPESENDKRRPVLHPKLAKTALGCQKQVSWQYFWKVEQAIRNLPKNSMILALEQTSNSLNFAKFKYQLPIALIVGNEVEGISEESLKLANAVIYIPMLGKHKSLNVSVACGVALYQILQKTGKLGKNPKF